MKLINDYSELIENEIAGISFPNEPKNLYDPLSYFLALGGKRMRPLLTILSGELFGEKKENLMPAAIAIELFHNFSLIHDDIMDAAPLRRGKATIHEKWNSNIAILSGDVLLVKAYQLLSHYDAHILSALFSVFNKTAIEVCEGQQLDMDFENRKEVS
ncbi:MAG: polyprenyl synthetase family protein, partial [Flavobacteriia bacterium]|nr:polyprenyl synthetase family protein [Flavobacteriia bacterium]